MNSWKIFRRLYYAYPKILLIIIVTALATSCIETPPAVKNVLDNAGSNRHELEKVINHYKNTNEKEKLKAAFFLLEHMDNKQGKVSSTLTPYYYLFNTASKLSGSGLTEDNINSVIRHKKDSLASIYGKNIFHQYKAKKDIHTVSAAYLIKNIDLAYKVWREKPWCSHVDFSRFCEYILPHRIYDEPLQSWRKQLYDELSKITDTVKQKDDPKAVCRAVNSYIAKDFTFLTEFEGYPFPGIMDMWDYKVGTCSHRYYIVTAAMRSVGIPVKIDMTPQWNDYPGSHSWMVLLDKDGRNIPFNGGEPEINFSDSSFVPMGSGNATTVYRKMYAWQPDALPTKLNNVYIPSFFQSTERYNVTREYGFPKTNATVNLKKPPPKEISHVFLCCFGYSYDIVPFAYQKVNGPKTTFEDIGRFGIYFPAFYKNKQFIIANNPFLVPKSGDKVHFYTPNKAHLQDIVLYRKYPPNNKMLQFGTSMCGAKIQASATPDFKNPVTLFTIDTIPEYFVEQQLSVDKPYRYYRYISDTGKIRVAEIQFIFDNNSREKQPFNMISNAKGNHEVKHAFDHDIRTNFNAPSGTWIGIDILKPKKLKGIRYLPRNNFNIIEKGDTYALLYFDYGWHKIATQKAKQHYIKFRDVPRNAVLLLRNLTRGTQERIFIYENGKQDWVRD